MMTNEHFQNIGYIFPKWKTNFFSFFSSSLHPPSLFNYVQVKGMYYSFIYMKQMLDTSWHNAA